MNARDRLWVALDVDEPDRARELIRLLGGLVGGFKIGMRLFYRTGPAFVRELTGQGIPVFLDLKLHDIPATVAGAVRALVRCGVAMLNVHAAGGKAMMQAAAHAAREEAGLLGINPPAVLGVTVLTSIDATVFRRELGFAGPIKEKVVAWAGLAAEAGLAGVVASPLEAGIIKARCGPSFLVVTPGIRPGGGGLDDQRRWATPAGAIRAGADCLVVGRPVVTAADPVAVVKEILNEIAGADPAASCAGRVLPGTKTDREQPGR
ncbi:MAG: orotidine-5'-phosphate decarboxylase [Desulfotomaculales bacterium]